ncbi:hypothetical protein K8R04_04510 [Candidatus Uhrbacteria bacterium]|nr:hypothetical protein [Candidatus Uhrbacteria bacterium]
MDTKKVPERIGLILSRMEIGGRRIVPDAPEGLCTLCGTGATHADSIVVSEDREHFTCREQIRKGHLSLMVLELDYLNVAKTIASDEVLYKRLERRLMPFVEKPSAANLCRMITFCLAEIDKDPSIGPVHKRYLSTLLNDIRKRYICSN